MPPRHGGSRAFHNKSRNSCLRCKHRRVKACIAFTHWINHVTNTSSKCSLQSPICANCHRRSERCIYPSFDSDTLWMHGTAERMSMSDGCLQSSESQTMSPETSCSPESIDQTVTLSLPDSALFSGQIDPTQTPFSQHDFLKLCFLDMVPLVPQSAEFPAPAVEEVELWTGPLLRQMARPGYLSHSLLSLYLLPKDSKAVLLKTPSSVPAYEQHIIATDLFRNSSFVVNDQNWAAITTFAVSIVIFQFATQQNCPVEAFDYIGILRMLRSSDSLARLVFPYLIKSDSWRFIYHRNSLPKPPLDQDAQNALDNLEDCIYLQPTTDANHCIKEAVRALKQWVDDCEGYPQKWRHYLAWPASISEKYLTLLSQHDDFALLILVYWCAFLQRAPRRWFMSYWPCRTASTAMRMLTADWGGVLEWPKKVFASISKEK